MDSAFFRSRYFIVSAVVAALVLGGAMAAYALTPALSQGTDEACGRMALGGRALAVSPSITNDSGRRIYQWSLDPGELRAGWAGACAAVGEIVIEPSPDGLLRVEARVEGDTQAAIDGTEVVVQVVDDGGALHVDARQLTSGRGGDVFSRHGASVTWIVQLPETGAWDLDATIDVGDVRVSRVMLVDARLASDVGEVRAIEVDLAGNLTAQTDVGGILLAPASVQAGRIRATTSVEDVEIRLPARADVGYDVRAESDVGNVDVRLGESEMTDHTSDGAGESAHARTAGYDQKPTRVEVVVETDVGDVTVVAA